MVDFLRFPGFLGIDDVGGGGGGDICEGYEGDISMPFLGCTLGGNGLVLVVLGAAGLYELTFPWFGNMAPPLLFGMWNELMLGEASEETENAGPASDIDGIGDGQDEIEDS